MDRFFKSLTSKRSSPTGKMGVKCIERLRPVSVSLNLDGAANVDDPIANTLNCLHTSAPIFKKFLSSEDLKADVSHQRQL